MSEPVTVAKVQVCMLASARQLKQELDQMCDEADTSTEQGLQAMVSGTWHTLTITVVVASVAVAITAVLKALPAYRGDVVPVESGVLFRMQQLLTPGRRFYATVRKQPCEANIKHTACHQSGAC